MLLKYSLRYLIYFSFCAFTFQYSTLIIKSFPLFLNQFAKSGIALVKSIQPAGIGPASFLF